MSNSAFDIFLDHEVDKFYEDLEDLEIPWPADEPAIEPNNDYENYDGWDDIQ